MQTKDQAAGGHNGRQTMTAVRRWTGRLIALGIGLACAWLLLEVLLRVAFPALPYIFQSALREVHVTPFTEKRLLPQPTWQFDLDYQYVSRPHVDAVQYPDPRVSFHLVTKPLLDPDSHVGFRVPSADWEPRWPVDGVVVGDSFAFCYTEYPACWVQNLADGYRLSLVNLGLGATGTVSHLRVMRTFGLPFEPRMVIWQWYGNDFNDDYGLALLNNEIEGRTFLYGPIESESALVRWLREYSAVYVALEMLTQDADALHVHTRYEDPYRVRDGELDLEFGRSYTLDSFDMADADNQFGWTRSEEAFLAARDQLAELDIALVIVLIPSKEEVYREWTEPVMGAEAIDLLSEGRLRMMAFCEAAGLRCLDVTPALLDRAAGREQLYWTADTHLNNWGNQVLAEVVGDYLVAEGLAGGE